MIRESGRRDWERRRHVPFDRLEGRADGTDVGCGVGRTVGKFDRAALRDEVEQSQSGGDASNHGVQMTLTGYRFEGLLDVHCLLWCVHVGESPSSTAA